MGSPLTVSCPQCKQAIKATQDLAGKKVRCKGCAHIFVIPAVAAEKPEPPKAPAAKPTPAAKPQQAKAKPPDDEDDVNPYSLTDHEEAAARCPHCAAVFESDQTVICIQCGYNTVTRQRVESKKVVENTPGDQLTWLMPGLLAAFSIFVLIGLDLIYVLLVPKWLKDGDWEFVAAAGFRLWFVIASLFAMFFAGKFAVERLILNPTPPEKVR